MSSGVFLRKSQEPAPAIPPALNLGVFRMSKTVLVVDDEMLIALDIQAQLAELGHHTVVAPHLAGALETLDRSPVDLVIVDWHLQDQVATPLVEVLKAS